MRTAPKKSNVTRLRSVAKTKPKLRALRSRIDPGEWQARVDLAAAYRLTASMGWSDMLGTHISCRVPGTDNQFLINPYGMLFEEITASSLIKCDTEGNKLSESPYEVNFAGFTIHSAIHMGRHDAAAVMHLHTGYGVAVSAQKDGLLPLTQKALTMPYSQLRYHDYEGVAHDLTERERILADLGDASLLILRNHGTLTVGASVGEMFARMYRLETACKYQILAMSGGAQVNQLPQEVINHTMQQGKELYSAGGRAVGGQLMWAALLRKLDREGSDYAV
jgi:ribulose-5-phosphate 4-epimerase/fuculose-1-phosphate aldolase